MIENISAVIITKNAAETIKVTLDSLSDFKEVIIYDSASKDKTLEIVGIKNAITRERVRQIIAKINRKIQKQKIHFKKLVDLNTEIKN